MKINFQNIIYKTNQKKSIEKPYFYSQKTKSDSFEYTTNPVSFLGNCSPSNFKITKIKNLRCPVCGLIMLTPDQERIFINDVFQKTGQDLANALEKYEDETIFLEDEAKSKHRTIYRPIKQEAVNIIKELAVKNPDLKLDGLVQLKAKEAINRLINIQLETVKKLEKYIDANIKDPQELSELKEIVAIYKRQITGESSTRFERKRFIYAISNIPNEEKHREQIKEIASELPRSDTEVNSFFVKYSHDRTPREIASKFVHQSIPTTEHLVPKSKNGKNHTSNYICDCSDCNSKRGNVDFNIWMEQVDNFQENLQEYIEEIFLELERNPNLKSFFSNYINELIRTIDKISNGKIKLKTPIYYLPKEIKLEQAQQTINKYQKQIQARKAEIESLQNYPHYDYIVLYSRVKKHIEILKNEISYIKNKISQASNKTQRQLGGKEIELEFEKLKEKQQYLENKKTKLENYIEKIRKQTPCFDLLDTRINEQKQLIAAVKGIKQKIVQMQNEISDEEKLRESIKRLNEKNQTLEKECLSIRQKFLFDINDKSAYEKLLHYQTLYLQACTMLNNADKKTNKKTGQTAWEIIKIAKDSVEKKYIAFSNMPNARYFSNKEKIDENNKAIAKCSMKLEEYNTTKQMIEFLNEQILEKTNGKTYQQVNQDYKDLILEKETVDKIINIEKLEKQLAATERTKDQQRAILRKLKSDKSIADDEFYRLVNKIY